MSRIGLQRLGEAKMRRRCAFFLSLLKYSLRSSSFDRLLYIRMRLTWPSTVPTMKTTRSLHLTTLPQSFGKNQSTSPSCHAIRGMRVRTTPSFTVVVGVHWTQATIPATLSSFSVIDRTTSPPVDSCTTKRSVSSTRWGLRGEL